MRATTDRPEHGVVRTPGCGTVPMMLGTGEASFGSDISMGNELAMSMWSQKRSGHPQPADDGCPFDDWERTSPYLTAGSTLYRYVGGVPRRTGELVVLEDCHSAKLVLFCIDELRALKLRDVDPAARASRAPLGRSRLRPPGRGRCSQLAPACWSISWAWPACRSGRAVRGDSGDLPIARAYGCSSASHRQLHVFNRTTGRS